MEFTTNKHDRFGAVRTAVIDGELWIVAGDLCRVLGGVKAADFTRRLDAEETRYITSMKTPHTCVNKQGLYHACMLNGGKEARELAKWIVACDRPRTSLTNDDIMNEAKAVAEGAARIQRFIDENMPVIRAAERMRDSIKADIEARLMAEEDADEDEGGQ